MTADTRPVHAEVDQVLDASGLNCPLPLLKTKAALNTMAAGALLQVLATDRHAPIDLQVFCARAGHEYIEHIETGAHLEIFIRKRA